MHTIDFNDVSFSYTDGASVLRGVTFHVDEGEIVALVGGNGTGKSTIAKLADAYLVPNSGTVNVAGLNSGDAASSDKALNVLHSNVGFVFQNPDDQLVASLVVDEVAFGPENLGLERREIIHRVGEALEAVGMMDFLGSDVNVLSGGQKQRIAIADALAMKPRAIILDEAASMLDRDAAEQVMGVLRRLAKTGIAVLMITHNAEEANAADRIYVLEDGSVNEVDHVDDTLEAARISIREGLRPNGDSGMTDEENAIEMRDVCFCYDEQDSRSVDIFNAAKACKPVLEGIDLDVRCGELLAITGPNGSGKSTLVQLMNGLLVPKTGTVNVFGTDTGSKVGANAARRRVGVCFQYPERSLFAQTVIDDVAYASRNMGFSDADARAYAAEALESVGLPAEIFGNRNPFTLSGGEQRKVALAGVLAMKPDVLVLDEPCAGFDPATHSRFLELIAKLKAEHQTIVMVSHVIEDVKLLADKVYELH